MNKENNKIDALIKDSLALYGKDGLYPYSCSDDVIESTAEHYGTTCWDFDNNSIDRENLGEILEALGYYELG